MKTIPLTKGKSAIVDDEDFETVSGYRWYPRKRGRNEYARTDFTRNGKRHQIRMHRMIMRAKKGQIIDHKNHNGLDNRRCNLRFTDQTGNNANMRPQHKYKGVSFRRSERKWRAYIYVKEKYIHLGAFRTSREAALAYNAAAVKYYGEFAFLNSVR